jgi:TolB protein
MLRRSALRHSALCRSAVALACCSLLAAIAGCDDKATAAASSASSPAAAPPGEARSIAGLPGALFYLRPESDELVRLTVSGPLKKVAGDAGAADVSPDGQRVATIPEAGGVLVTDSEGGSPHTLIGGPIAPEVGAAFSPDGAKLLVGKAGPDDANHPGVVDVATGTFTELPASLREYLNFRWTGDGKRLVFATGDCALLTSDAAGGDVREVPVVGDGDTAKNPTGTYACDPVSVNTDGTRVTVNLKATDEPVGETSDAIADTVLDTATGAPVPLPVKGDILAALYRTDGVLLVRSRDGDRTTLTQVSPAGTALASVVEPASMELFDLVAYTR